MQLELDVDHSITRKQQSKRGLEVLLTLIEDASLLYQLPTPNAFTALTSVCGRLRILNKTHLRLWLRLRFSDINNVHTDLIPNHQDEPLSKQLIEQCVQTGQSEVLHVLLQNLPTMSVLYGESITHLIDLATGRLFISKIDHYEIVQVLLQWYNAQVRGDDIQLKQSCAYDPHKFSIDYAQVPADAIRMAVKMNRFEMFDFFIKFTRLCRMDSSDSTMDSDYNDAND
ncbi:hypothetical protein HDU76_009894 [Blyttiomyces sp. JEL0837]|nr:hypothetical protein HDU76_009894 [Blyttiomyces sp. JEL0837]